MNESALLAFRQALNLLRSKPLKYKEAIPLLQEAAQAGYAEAAFQLGGCYVYGLGTPTQISQATYWLKQAADSGHLAARYNLLLLREGNNDIALAELLPHYRELGEAGFLAAQIRLMNHFSHQNDTKQALYWAKKAAAQQHPHAQYFLAHYHQNSPHPNLLAAHELYRQAAEQGLTAAHWQLANQYLYGQGVEASHIKARYHFQIAAKGGITGAQSEYARLLLEDPLADNQQIAEAIRWLQHAAQQHNTEAHAMLAKFYLTGKYMERNQAAALNHASSAARHNHPEALRLLGDIYQYGMGVEADTDLAQSYYRRAAKHGDIASRQKLLLADALKPSKAVDSQHSAATIAYHKRNEELYQSAFARHYGLGCRQDYAEALRLYQQAAVHHHAKAQTNLGIMYYNGQGVKKDPARAAHWFEQAAQQGDTKAQYNLACLYHHGYGVQQNNDTACRWLQAAIDNGHEDPQALQQLLLNWQQPATGPAEPKTTDTAVSRLPTAVTKTPPLSSLGH